VLANPTNPTGSGVDGVHLIGPATYVTIRGVKAAIIDDTIALNFADGNVTVSGGIPFINFSNVYLGTGQYIDVSDVHTVGGSNPVRILVGSDPNGNIHPCSALDIKVSGVKGTTWNPGCSCASYPAIGTGGVKNRITFQDWSVQPMSGTVRTAVGFWWGGTCDNISLRGVKFGDLLANSSTGANAHQVMLGSDAAIGRFEMVDWAICEDSSETTSVNPLVSISQGSIDKLLLKNCSWKRQSHTSAAMVSVSGGSVNDVIVSDCECDNINNVVSITGGTVGTVTTTGLTHVNANSNPSVNIGSGVTVARMRSSGSNTVQLQAGSGTVTSKKTDGTEDS
jgi:hypothetical protein